MWTKEGLCIKAHYVVLESITEQITKQNIGMKLIWTEQNKKKTKKQNGILNVPPTQPAAGKRLAIVIFHFPLVQVL